MGDRMENTEGRVYSTAIQEIEVASCGKITGNSLINSIIQAARNVMNSITSSINWYRIINYHI